MITSITDAEELSEISGGRRRRSIRRTSRNGNSVSTATSSGFGDVVNLDARVNTSSDFSSAFSQDFGSRFTSDFGSIGSFGSFGDLSRFFSRF